MAIARRLTAMGHAVDVLTAAADDPPPDLRITTLPVRALSNHGRNAGFSARLLAEAPRYDVVAGFDALEGLDLLYCANPPVRIRGPLDRLNPRKRALLRLERACFGPQSATRLLLLSAPQREAYAARWSVDPQRLDLVPPTIERSRVLDQNGRRAARTRLRAALNAAPEVPLWLFVGAYPQTKGLDRIIAAMSHCPDARLLVAGPHPDALDKLRRDADAAGVASRIDWLGARDDIPALMAAADLLVHPARLDVTGTVILEALGNGLPVITTEVCGYAGHVAAAEAGRVVAEPFTQGDFVAALRDAKQDTRQRWQDNALRYAHQHDLFGGLDAAAREIAALPPRRSARD
jgi:UDP-glucose:(heptosyl)LPS alpha-1,3-glucosyltransferase